MGAEFDEYDVFLDSWDPREILRYATLEFNLHDVVVQARLIDDSASLAELTRTEFLEGPKTMTDVEKMLRKHAFFGTRQAEWSSQFRDYVLGEGVDETKFDQFVHCFATLWADGKGRRQGSPEMITIKASIRDYDRIYHAENAGRFVSKAIADDIAPLLEIWEIEVILRANANLIESFIPDYLHELEGDHGGP